MDFNQKQKNLLFGALGILSLGGIVSIVSADMGEIRMNSDFNYAPQHIEEVVFVPDGATRYDTDKLIHMNLQGGIITVSDSIVAGTSGGNSISGVENSFILGGKENKITATNTTSGSIIGGGSGNKIENSNYAVILGGKNNTVSSQSNESIILGGEGNTVKGGKGIIIGNHNRISNKKNGKETIVIGNNIAVTGSDNVLMGKDYQFSGSNSFVWSTKNEKITGDNEFIIKNTHGMAINLDQNEAEGIGLALKGALKIGEGTSELTGNIEGAIKRMGNCLCYNDGKNWKPTKSDLICGIMCRSEKPVPGPTPNTCLSGVLLKSASNMSGDYRSCIGVSGTDLITKTYTNCHTGFYFFSGTNTTTQLSGKTFEGTGVCKEMTQYANCEGTKISANETLYFPSSIQQTWSGTMQEFLGRAQWYYNDSLISGTCAYTCNTGYSYKLDTIDGVCRKLIVTFDPDGGTLATTTKNYISGAKLGTNTPTKKGYTFSGWKVQETAYVTDKRGKIISTDKYKKGTLVNANTLVRTDLQLGANWKANQYKIIYQLNGGSGNSYPTTVAFGDTFTITQPIKSGYLFNGWDIKGMDSSTHFYGSFTTTKTTLSGTKETSFKNLNATNGATVTFTANWSPNSYLIDYDLDGGTFSKTQPTSPLFDQAFSVENPTKPGHTFLGWTISGMDLGSHICGGKTTTAQSISGITGTNFKNLTHQNRATIFFTAQWKKNTFLFDLNGYLDGELSGFLGGYGTCDIYINGVLRANDDPIGTVIENIPYGSTYEVKDCKANYGYVFGGGCVDVADNHGKMSGTFTDSDIRVAVIFNKEAKINGKCGTNGCLQGTKTNEKETSNKITWKCEGLFGGDSQSCQTCKEHYTGSTCQGETLSCGTAPSYATLGASSYTFAGTLKSWTNTVSGTLGACDFRCNENYERNTSEKACQGKILSCGTQPEHSEIGAETYRFAGTLKNWNYKATGSLGDCDFRCQSNYTRNATTKKCVADTQTGTCTGLPDHAKWNVSTFKQTWNGSIWDPAQKVGILATTGECSYSCNTGYEGNDCTAKTITIKYINGTDITTGTAKYDQDYTLLSAPTKGGSLFLGRSGENKLYSGGDTLSKALVNKAITDGKNSIDFVAEWEESPKGPYTITLVNHGDITSGTTSVIIEYGKTIFSPITKPTYTENTIQFQGYYTEPGGNGTQRIDNFGNWVNTTNSTFTSDTTLYAREPCARGSTLPECKPIVITFRVTDNGYFDYPRYLADGYDLYQLSTTCNNETSLYCDSTTTSQNFCLNGRQHKCNTRGLENATYNSGNALTKTFQNKQEKGQNYRLYTPETKHNSKTFVGWFTQPAGGKQITNEDIVTSDITLYSQWTTGKIDGKCSNTRGDCLQGKATDLFENTETHQYEWVCKGENNGTNVPCGKDIEYTLSFNTLGGNEIPSQTGLYGGTWHEVANPYRYHSIFLGWLFDEVEYTLPNTITGDVVLDANWDCEEGYTSNKEGNECIEETEDIEKYTIYYNANGGTWENGIPAPQERITGSTIEIISDKPIWDNGYWHFSIRSTSSGGGGGALGNYHNANYGTTITSSFIDRYADKETKSLTLYAQKDINSCSIIFDLQGGTKTCLSNNTTCSTSENTVFINTCLKSDSAIFRTSGKHWIANGRTGYSFVGWKDGSGTLLTENDIRSSPYLNQTYYAEWKSTCWTGYIRTKHSGGYTPIYDEIPSNPYSGQTYQSGDAIYQWTCPSKTQPVCGSSHNTCAVGSTYCEAENDVGTDDKWICYSNDDINITVTCRGYDNYHRGSWSFYTSNNCDAYNSASQVSDCIKGNVRKTTAQKITSESDCSKYNFSTRDLNSCKGWNRGGGGSCAYTKRECQSEYIVNQPGTKGGTCSSRYKITYDLNYPGGNKIIKYKKQNESIKLNMGSTTQPERDHYTFLHRSTCKDNNGQNCSSYSFNTDYKKLSDLYLYAIWKGEQIKVNYWTNAKQDIGKNYEKINCSTCSTYTYGSNQNLPSPEKNGYYFRGRYTIPQTDIPIYGVDANSFVITQDMIGIGNIKGNEAQIKAITNKGIDKKKIITKTEYTKLEEKSKQGSMRSQRLYKALLNTSTTIEKLIEEDHSYQLYTGIGTQSPHTNSKDTINLFAWWDYDQGIWRDGNYGSSERGEGDWNELKDTVNYNYGQMDFYNETKEWDCGGGKGSCNSNRGSDYDYIGLSNPTMEKGTKCNLSQNLPNPVGDLNFRYIKWRDLSKGWDRFQIYGCYFAVGNTKSDWHLYDEVWGALAGAGAFGGGAMLTAVFSNPRSAIAGFGVLIGGLFVHNEKEWTYVFSQDQVFQLNNDSGRNWAYNPMTIKEWLKQHSTGTTWVAHLSSLKK